MIDQEGFDSQYGSLFGDLAALARALGAGSDAEDVAQEALLHARDHLDQLREPDKLRAWVRRMAVRGACRARGRHLAALDAELMERLPAAEFPDVDVAAAIAGLPERERIAVTLVYGFEEGMAWAFVGGLCLDLFLMRPLGSHVFELLIAVALAALAEPLLRRSRYAGCVIAVFVVTPVFLVVSDATTALLRPPAPPLYITDLIAAAVANAIVAAVAVPFLVGIKRRAEQRERVLWWR